MAAENNVSIDDLNLTASRRAVLDIVMRSEKPQKAYDILSDLQKVIPHAKPPTVYRALDYLINKRLLHRVNEQNAFVACKQSSKCHHGHTHRFNMIFTCTKCGIIFEESNSVLTAVVSEMASTLGFRTDSKMIECPGICQNCASEIA